jgi:hypothetical protein
VKAKITVYFAWLLLLGFSLAAANVSSQTIAYRQTDLASSVPNVTNNLTPDLVDPWGMAFLSGQPFFIADSKTGRVTTLDATGLGVSSILEQGRKIGRDGVS